MDDISDTELDSMLQEMDVDNEPTEAQNKMSTDMAAGGCSSAVAADAMNADSFSQASTVEISEVKAAPVLMTELKTCSTEAVAVEEEEVAANNSIASSYTSSESLMAEEEQQLEDANNIRTDYEEHSATSDEQAAVNVNNGDVHDDADDESRPQRPTTLEIPVAKDAATAASGMYANAGQTPPGMGQVQVESAGLEESAAAASKFPL